MRESYVLSVAMEEKSKRKGKNQRKFVTFNGECLGILSKFSRKKKKKIYYNQGPMSGGTEISLDNTKVIVCISISISWT